MTVAVLPSASNFVQRMLTNILQSDQLYNIDTRSYGRSNLAKYEVKFPCA